MKTFTAFAAGVVVGVILVRWQRPLMREAAKAVAQAKEAIGGASEVLREEFEDATAEAEDELKQKPATG